MWSLPNIESLNRQAVAAYKKSKGKTPGLRGKKCEWCNEPAKVAEPYYDVFGDADIPKGHILLCRDHYDSGVFHETYFWCSSCNRYQVRNYTWELYCTTTDDGEEVCLRCAFKDYIAEPSNWITEPPGLIDIAKLKKVPHLIAVESTYWEDDLIFIGNAEFDSYSGHQISGESLEHIVNKALAQAGTRDLLGGKSVEPRCILILDAGYQFAVSFGVYIERKFPSCWRRGGKKEEEQ